MPAERAGSAFLTFLSLKKKRKKKIEICLAVKNRLGLSGRRRRWNDLTEQHWDMYITVCKKQVTSVSSVHHAGHSKCLLWDSPKGSGGEGGGRGVQERWGGGIHACLWAIHVDVWQKPSQYCKVIILQLNLKIKYLRSIPKKRNVLLLYKQKRFYLQLYTSTIFLTQGPRLCRTALVPRYWAIASDTLGG